ncbi:TPA: archease [Candidatus Woesearchaeota archaeon]|nr:archease [Candidatus Woesearchaeota archaeon]HII68659.1 archease [Candidatus Woesearchaeota archaeon]
MEGDRRFEFFPHTADAKFRAYGKSLGEAFANAALALFEIMTDTSAVKPAMKKKLRAKAERPETLLYDFLESLVILIDTDNFLLHDVERIEIKKKGGMLSLHAVAVGDDAAEYSVGTAIKAITYNDMLVEEKDGKVMVQVVPDL